MRGKIIDPGPLVFPGRAERELWLRARDKRAVSAGLGERDLGGACGSSGRAPAAPHAPPGPTAADKMLQGAERQGTSHNASAGDDS